MNTLIETKTKFLESKFFVVETKNISFLSDATSLALGLIKINEREHMFFPIDNMKNDNAQKEEMKANETKIYLTRLRHITEKHKKGVFRNNIGKIENYGIKFHTGSSSVAPAALREQQIRFALRSKINEELKRLENEGIIEDVTGEPIPG